MWKSDSLTNRSLRYCGARSFRGLHLKNEVNEITQSQSNMGLAILKYIDRGQSPCRFSVISSENASYSARGEYQMMGLQMQFLSKWQRSLATLCYWPLSFTKLLSCPLSTNFCLIFIMGLFYNENDSIFSWKD